MTSVTGPGGSRPRAARLGLFGGTFDPPHCGHVAVARDVADALDLERVLWVPAREPPHRDPAAPSDPALRLEMTRAAVAADPRFEASDLELRREGPSYTVDTVRAVRRMHPDAELFVIVGVDQYRELDDWREPLGILEEARLAVIDREGASAEAVHPRVLEGVERVTLDDVTSRGGAAPLPPVVFVPVGRVDVSSSDVRTRCAEGGDVRALVPAAVLAVIEREGLYA